MNCIRAVFAFKFTKAIDQNTLIKSIDKSSINLRMKTSQSWGFKRVEKNVIFYSISL